LSNGQGTFEPAQNFAPGSAELATVAVGDFNGDGKLNLAVGTPGVLNSSKWSILLGNGDGMFQAAQDYCLPSDSDPDLVVAAGDFNGDGHPDLAGGYAGEVVILFNAANW